MLYLAASKLGDLAHQPPIPIRKMFKQESCPHEASEEVLASPYRACGLMLVKQWPPPAAHEGAICCCCE